MKVNIDRLIEEVYRDIGKKDKDLEADIEDFIIERIGEECIVEKDSELYKREKEIEELVKEIKIDNMTEKLGELEELYLFTNDLKNIESYKLGFMDALKLLYKKK